MNPVIRQESPSDAAAIHTVTAAAFLDAPHAAHTEQFIVDALREAGALAVSLVAEQGGEVVGHVALSPVLISDGAAGCVLVGDPAYYSRFGFKPEPRLVRPDVPAEYFQALPFGSSMPRGVVTFHEAFNARGRSCAAGPTVLPTRISPDPPSGPAAFGGELTLSWRIAEEEADDGAREEHDLPLVRR